MAQSYGINADTMRHFSRCEAVEVNLATDSTTAVNAACEVLGVYVDTVLSAHACPILDNATEKFRLIASLAAGSLLTFPAAVQFATSLVVDPDDTATGLITIFYRLT